MWKNRTKRTQMAAPAHRTALHFVIPIFLIYTLPIYRFLLFSFIYKYIYGICILCKMYIGICVVYRRVCCSKKLCQDTTHSLAGIYTKGCKARYGFTVYCRHRALM